MTMITPIEITSNSNVKHPKRLNEKQAAEEIKALVSQLISSNPNITEDQVRIEVSNHLENLEKNGTKIGKAKAKELGKLSETIKECRPKPIVTSPVIKPQPVIKTTEIPTESFIANSPMVKPKIQTTPSKKEEKLIKKLEKQGLTEAVPQGVSERTQWEEQEAKKNASEPQKSNNQNKKEVNSQYMSRKKKKAAKKQGEAQSRVEHKQTRINNSKPARNARYCTSQGIMTTDARKAFEFVENHNMSANVKPLDAQISYQSFLNAGMVQPEKSARESMAVFENAGLLPQAEVAPQTPTANTSARRTRTHNNRSYYSTSNNHHRRGGNKYTRLQPQTQQEAVLHQLQTALNKL